MIHRCNQPKKTAKYSQWSRKIILNANLVLESGATWQEFWYASQCLQLGLYHLHLNPYHILWYVHRALIFYICILKYSVIKNLLQQWFPAHFIFILPDNSLPSGIYHAFIILLNISISFSYITFLCGVQGDCSWFSNKTRKGGLINSHNHYLKKWQGTNIYH